MTRVGKRVLLQTRIARHIAFAVVVSLVLSALVLVVFRHQSVRRNMERSARTYASLISEPLTHLVEFLGSSGKGLLDQQVAQLRELNADVERLEIVDVRGQVVLRAEGNNVILFGDGIESPTITDRELLRAIEGLESTATQVTDPDGSDAYRVVAPVGRSSAAFVAVVIGADSCDRSGADALGLCCARRGHHTRCRSVARGRHANPRGPPRRASLDQFPRRDRRACRRIQFDGR
jgi:hypothetical protein